MPVQRFPLFNVDKFLAVIADDCNLSSKCLKLLLCCVNVLFIFYSFMDFLKYHR